MMHRIVLAVALTAAAFLVPALATGNEGTKGNGLSYCDENYLDLYAKVDPGGPNLVRDGLNGKPAGEDRICRKVDILYEIRQAEIAAAAEAAAAEAAAEAPATTTTDASGYSGGYSIPEDIVMCESGGDWGAVNPSSGAGGAYQIMPSTWEAYGGSAAGPAAASPEEQSAIAAEIYADSGGSAWVC
jgi:hypothetical protein